ncbi:MAG TPA: STAS domain-containing protein [Nitrospiraceae bacterium]|nr:STAS domain-containing protein [Nitrospiraceae bacterium]
MEIKTRVLPNATILDLAGDLTYANRVSLKTAVESARQAGCRHLILNMEQVRFLDSSVLGMLALFCQSFRHSKSKLSLLRPQAYVREIMSLASIQKMIPLYESEQEAVASVAVPSTC